MGTAIKHPVPDRVKPSFVIFVIRAIWRLALSVRVSGCQNYKCRLNPVWHRMLYSCTHMATVGFKGLLKYRWRVASLCWSVFRCAVVVNCDWRYGEHNWMLDVDMDCSATESGWFELKAYITGGNSSSEWWESNVVQDPECGGNVGGNRPYATSNHVARCGYINVFEYQQPGCTIDSL